MLEFAFCVSSAINFDNFHLTLCNVTQVFYLIFLTRLLLLCWKKIRVGELLHVWILNRTCSYFFLSVDISYYFSLALAETYGYIL